MSRYPCHIGIFQPQIAAWRNYERSNTPISEKFAPAIIPILKLKRSDAIAQLTFISVVDWASDVI